MKRTFLTAGLGLAALLGVSMLLVALLTGEHPPAAQTPAVALAQPPPAAPPAEAPTLPPALARVRPAPALRSWQASAQDPSAPPMPDRVTRKAVRKGLQAASIQSRLAHCVDRDRDAGFGGGARPAPVPRANPAVLVLDLETAGDQVKVADARVQSWGGVSEKTASCAREALRGQVVATARPGTPERMQMPFPLTPRSRALAATR